MKTLWTRKLKTGSFEAIYFHTVCGYTEECRMIISNLDELTSYAKENDYVIQPFDSSEDNMNFKSRYFRFY